MAKSKDVKLRYAVDIPDPNNLDGECVNLGYFETHKQAIAWAKKNLGADGKGNINVISKMPWEED